MRLAHLILVHNNPKQLERLLSRLSSELSDVYIHVDKKSTLSDFEYLSTLPNVFFIKKRISVGWGNYSMVNATIKSIEEILETQILYSHINLLSGQDYLLKSIHEIEQFFFANKDNSYIEYASINLQWVEAKNRLLKYNLGDLSIPFKFRIQNFMNSFLPNRKIPYNLEPYGASQWFTLTPNSLRYVISFLKEKPRAKFFFKCTWAVDEIIFQTILMNSDFKDSLINDNKRFIVFKDNEANPKIFQISDAETLIKSQKFFARKFSMQTDSLILDYLDSIVN
jgi:hypothetical protein